MNHETYSYSIRGDFLQFQFISEGPRGNITKFIRFQPRISGSISYFNLGFGDYDPRTDTVDDHARSNNLDQAKILATIAASVLEFTHHFPGTFVYATGSTAARTRLYQMGIASNWDEIEPLLYVFGFIPGQGWEPFRKNVSYQGFLVKRKKM